MTEKKGGRERKEGMHTTVFMCVSVFATHLMALIFFRQEDLILLSGFQVTIIRVSTNPYRCRSGIPWWWFGATSSYQNWIRWDSTKWNPKAVTYLNRPSDAGSRTSLTQNPKKAFSKFSAPVPSLSHRDPTRKLNADLRFTLSFASLYQGSIWGKWKNSKVFSRRQ